MVFLNFWPWTLGVSNETGSAMIAFRTFLAVRRDVFLAENQRIAYNVRRALVR